MSSTRTIASARREVELDVERLVLRSLKEGCPEEHLAKVWATLEPADFQSATHGRIYAAWRGLASDHQPLDWVHLLLALGDDLELCGGQSGLLEAMQPCNREIDDRFSHRSLLSLAVVLKGLSRRRATARLARTISEDPARLAELLPELEATRAAEKPADQTVYLDLEAIRANGIPAVRWIIPGWLAEQDVAMLAGDGGIGKSTTAAALSVSLATGQPWCGILPERPVQTLYFDEEQSEMECSRMFLRLGAPCPNLRVACQQGVNLTTAQGLARLEQEIKLHRPELVVLDSVQQVFAGVNENDAGEVARVYAELFRLRRSYGVIFLLLHHMRKPPSEGKIALIHMIRGSTAHQTQCSTLWTAIQPQRGLLELSQAKRRGAEKQSLRISYSADGDNGPITLAGEGPVEDTDSAQERAESFIAAYLYERGQSRRKDIVAAAQAEEPPIAERSVERALSHLTDRLKTTEKVGRGLYRVRANEAPSELWQ